MTSCLSQFRLLPESTIGDVVCKQWIVRSRGCGGRKSEIKVPAWLGAHEGPFQVAGCHLPALSSRGGEQRAAACLVVHEGPSPSPHLIPITAQRPPNTMTWGRDASIQSITRAHGRSLAELPKNKLNRKHLAWTMWTPGIKLLIPSSEWPRRPMGMPLGLVAPGS